MEDSPQEELRSETGARPREKGEQKVGCIKGTGKERRGVGKGGRREREKSRAGVERTRQGAVKLPVHELSQNV
eukprot:6023439-Pleurochrysis_carterae.AAC.2